MPLTEKKEIDCGMSRPLRILRIQYPGAFCHITCRGNERRAIFSSDADRQAFLLFLQESLRIYTVILHSLKVPGDWGDDRA